MGSFRAVSIWKFKEGQVHTKIPRSYVIWHSKANSRLKRLADNMNDYQELSTIMKSEIVNTENHFKAHQRELSKSDIPINTTMNTWYDIGLSIKKRNKKEKITNGSKVIPSRFTELSDLINCKC